MNEQYTQASYQSVRKLVANIVDESGSHHLSKPFDYLITVMIIVTTVSIILESEDWSNASFHRVFTIIEYLSLVVFGVEYVLRIWTAPELSRFSLEGVKKSDAKSRWKYVFSPMAIIDLFAILPVILTLLIIDLRFLRVIRLLRLFKLTRYNSSMGMIINVLVEEKDAILSAFFILFFMLVLSSSGIYLLEHSEQPDKFGSIPKAMWWAMVTLTTVGYGDVTPITAGGKFFGAIITLIGIGIVALPAGILASAFSERLHLNREIFEKALQNSLIDGKISREEEIHLKALQVELNISSSAAKFLFKREVERLRKRELLTRLEKKNQAHRDKQKLKKCPHCGEKLS